MQEKPTLATGPPSSDFSDTQSLQAVSDRADSSTYSSPAVSPMRRLPSPVAAPNQSCPIAGSCFTPSSDGSNQVPQSLAEEACKGSTVGAAPCPEADERKPQADCSTRPQHEFLAGYIGHRRHDALFFDASDDVKTHKAPKTKRRARVQKKGKIVLLHIGQM